VWGTVVPPVTLTGVVVAQVCLEGVHADDIVARKASFTTMLPTPEDTYQPPRRHGKATPSNVQDAIEPTVSTALRVQLPCPTPR